MIFKIEGFSTVKVSHNLLLIDVSFTLSNSSQRVHTYISDCWLKLPSHDQLKTQKLGGKLIDILNHHFLSIQNRLHCCITLCWHSIQFISCSRAFGHLIHPDLHCRHSNYPYWDTDTIQSLNIYSLMPAKKTQSVVEGCVIWSKHPEQAGKWTLSWDCSVKCCFQGRHAFQKDPFKRFKIWYLQWSVWHCSSVHKWFMWAVSHLQLLIFFLGHLGAAETSCENNISKLFANHNWPALLLPKYRILTQINVKICDFAAAPDLVWIQREGNCRVQS